MISRHLDRSMEKLKKMILELSAAVEQDVQMAVQAVSERNPRLAQLVIDSDNDIDKLEVDIEEECLQILALHQPVAIDLRFVVSVLKINNDLERVGDEAVNIAERAQYLAQSQVFEIPFDFTIMLEKSKLMLQHALDALMNMDAALAHQVGAQDDEIDELNRQMYTYVQDSIRAQPEHVEALIHLLSVSRHLERIADYATNIAEDVVYMIEGEIIRHKPENFV